MVASLVASVAPIQSNVYARVRPVSRIVRIWLCSAEKSTMHES